ncbi:MAG TPA: efflux RND transporter periplasmic adaptor subunit [Chitinophagaceae bacterium]|nr:efflux RND transporter periplasmic adaptor subunit [Chitinophagaceae bacterium]
MKNNILTVSVISLSLLLASCGAKSDSQGNSELAQKKAKLEELKKQKDKIDADMLALQNEIEKLDPSSKQVKTKLVAVAAVQPQSFTHYIDLQGIIDADDISYVSPSNGVGGIVKKVFIKKGDFVKKGQQLLKLDDAVYLKNLQQVQSQLDYAKDILQRQQNLWDEKIGREIDLITAKNNVTNLENQISTLKEQWDQTNIYADVSGIADQVNIRVGELFTGFAGATPQIRIVNTSRMKATVQVPENYLSKVKQGAPMQVTLPDVNKSFTTSVSVSGNIIDPNSRSFYVDGKLPADKDLRPNQVAQIKIQDYAAADAITVPVNTLQTDEKGKFVLVASDENGKTIARKKAVTIGQLYGDRIEITSGLSIGDRLVVDGYQGLFDGQALTVAAQ